MLHCFTVRSVNTAEVQDGAVSAISMIVDAPSLYPDLYGSNGEPKDEKSRDELTRLYELLGAEFPEC